MPLIPLEQRLHEVMQRHQHHADMIFLFDVQRDIEVVVADHLLQVLKAFPTKKCSCGADLHMVPNGTGFSTPFDRLANNHFLNCPDRDKYKKKGGQ